MSKSDEEYARDKFGPADKLGIMRFVQGCAYARLSKSCSRCGGSGCYECNSQSALKDYRPIVEEMRSSLDECLDYVQVYFYSLGLPANMKKELRSIISRAEKLLGKKDE